VLSDTEVERVLVVTAHPDDVDFGAAGTVALWTAAGIEVHYCLVTDGDAGGFDETIPREAMGPMRRAEQTRAAKEVGVEHLHFLGYPDGCVLPTLELRRDLARLIRLVRPQRVLCQSAERNLARIFASHPDHLAVGEAALCAVYPDSRNRFTFTELLAEGLEPWTVQEVWIMGGPDPDHAVDVTDTAERKLAALRCHETQLPDPDATMEMVRGWLQRTAEAMGLPEGRLAEAFRVVQTG
jgi:LmbE family N-acetylglucosaminyl deacetylase